MGGSTAVATVLLLVAYLQVSLAVDIPKHVPNVWGGTAYGLMAPYMGHSSHLFAFSGADGETQEGSGFTGLLLPELYAVNLFVFNRGSDLNSHKLKLSIGDGLGNGTLVAASSDTIVVESQQAVSELVLTYSAWNVLIGYSPVVLLTSDDDSPLHLDEQGCISTGHSIALCKGEDNVFAVAYGEGNATDIAAAALRTHGSKHMVDAVASTRLAALANLPPPAMSSNLSDLPPPAMSSNLSDLARLSAKMFSVMRVNTLSPEGASSTHWSTPDKAPHQAMWLWDSCFHAIGRQVVEPGLAWEFLHALLDNAASDGRVPIQLSPWDHGDPHPTLTQPPNLCLATKFAYNAGGVSKSQLAWALPKLERYIEWDIQFRGGREGLLHWNTGSEAGTDNSPLWDSPHAETDQMASTEFSSYAALEMEYLSQFHQILGNQTAARYWAARSKSLADLIHSLLWDDDDQFYYYLSNKTNSFVKVQTISGFAPLLLAGVSDDRVAALISHLNDPAKFASKVPIPTVAKDYITDLCPENSTNMWRRPVWTNTNLYVIWALRRYAHVPGALEAANRIQKSTVEMVGSSYNKWGTTFEYYDSNGKVEPPFLDRKSQVHTGGVRDYHWTAATTFYLLHRPDASLP